MDLRRLSPSSDGQVTNMPLLLPPLFADVLNRIDEPSPPTTAIEAAQRWTDAWWQFAEGMSYLNPATLVASKASATSAFLGVITGAFTPQADATPFLWALEGAMRAGWATLSSPLSLLPPFISITPAPAPFAPLAAYIPTVGVNSLSKVTSRLQLATIIYTWTLTNLAVTPTSTSPFI